MTDKTFRRPFRLEGLAFGEWRLQSTFATREAAVSWLRARPTRIIDTRTGQDVTTESEPIADPEARVLAAEVAARGYRERAEKAEAERDALAAQIERVRALHRPVGVERVGTRNALVQVCEECWTVGHEMFPDASLGDEDYEACAWPCGAVRALDGEGGE